MGRAVPTVREVPTGLRPYDVIRTKRDGGELSREQIAYAIRGYTAGVVPDYAMSALLMAVYIKGLSKRELAYWTEEMLHSGEVIDLSQIEGPKIDKHSTGGVGDKVSLPLAPLAAAAGVRVPMVSGRGLGHTGGTLDKLESIEGFRVDLDTSKYRELVAKVGACLIGQTAEIAPADKRIYALRDVTATVESIPLIASSIMSKKLAEGIDGLVLDVKVGSGAFMKDARKAGELARTMVDIGKRMRKKVVAVMTDMDQPLGWAVGNALEVREAVQVLRGHGPDDVARVTIELGAWMLKLGGVVRNIEDGRHRIQARIEDGSGLEKLREIVAAQGGDVSMIDNPARLPHAAQTVEVSAPKGGYVARIDAEAVGVTALRLGAGRERVSDEIDPAVGVMLQAKVGDRVKRGQPLATLYVNASERLEESRERLRTAFRITSQKPRKRPLIRKVVGV